jgi:hypothetical protein
VAAAEVAEVAQVLAFLNSEADECLCWNVVIWSTVDSSNLTAISPKVPKSFVGNIVNTNNPKVGSIGIRSKRLATYCYSLTKNSCKSQSRFY